MFTVKNVGDRAVRIYVPRQYCYVPIEPGAALDIERVELPAGVKLVKREGSILEVRAA